MATKFDSFYIGSVEIRPPLVVAPLHDITDQFFRSMIWRIGGMGLIVSEMIASEALIRNVHKAQAMMIKKEAYPYAIQLCGNNPASLRKAARIAEASGANIIDFNMGCPAHNVTSNGGGSALLKDICLAESCIKAIVQAVNIPVTVKMRTGWSSHEKEHTTYINFLHMFKDIGIKALTIHPRTRAQQYKGNANWTLIKQAVDFGLTFPIIGNGDINNPIDAMRMLKETGCAGLMIGRAMLTNLWIFQQVLNPNLIITENQRIDLCINFFHLLINSIEPLTALHKMKKIGSWFTKDIKNGAKLRHSLQACSNPEMLLTAMKQLKEDNLSA